MELIYFILIGLIAGWVASELMTGRGLGLVGDIIVGIVGALIGGSIFGLLGISAYGTLGILVMATLGSVAFLAIISLIKKPT